MADGVIRDVPERTIDELPDELRIVFVACVVDSMTPGQFAELFSLRSETVGARLHEARSLPGDVLMRQFGPAIDAVYPLDDSRSDRITNAVMDRLAHADKVAQHESGLADARSGCKPIATTIGSETRLVRQRGFQAARQVMVPERRCTSRVLCASCGATWVTEGIVAARIINSHWPL